MTAEQADVVVVGAGLAGLRCAADLTAAGRHVVVLEAADDIGGRVRTDAVDGFLVDRGFQLLNPAYDAVKDGVDVERLALQSFEAGVAGRTDRGTVKLGHPLHAPRLLPGSAAVLARRARESATLLRWARPLLHAPGTSLATHLHRLAEKGDLPLTVRESLDRAGVDGVLRRVLEAFLAGVVLDDEGDTSFPFVLLLVSSFLRGTPGLPTAGMGALPRQLAESLPAVHCGTEVDAVTHGPAGWTVTSGNGEWTARDVVVAADPVSGSRLVGLPRPEVRGVVTAWFATGDEVPDTKLLHVDARERPTGPLVNAAVVSAAAPSYAPPGRGLVQGSALVGPDRERPTEAQLRAHAGDLLGCSTAGWETVAVHDVPLALPAQPPPFRTCAEVRVRDGLYVCGDHRDTASIQGALVSGRRTARAVLAA